VTVTNEANGDPGLEGMELAHYVRDTVVPAMTAVRDCADKLERLVADDLWPLPKYMEVLFIK
jgi:glutamine synthetase